MDLTPYILPYPYEAYTKFNRSRKESFDKYKDKIYSWVENNTSSMDITKHIENAFSYIEDSKINIAIKEWFYNHSDKLRYIGDFSGLDFGIQFEEEYEKTSIRFPMRIDEEDKQLYPSYDENIFKSMQIISRLEWMYSNCEFIPFRIIYEDIYVNNYYSHKFSHIKKNKYIMDLLKGYIENLNFQPKDDVYYFVMYNKLGYYLKRDLDKSPKHK